MADNAGVTHRHVVLPRGINLGRLNKVPMPALRGRLAACGFAGVQTLLQSGNIVLDADEAEGERVAGQVRAVLRESFGVDVPCVVRSPEQIRAVVALNPLADLATDPARYLVTFLTATPPAEAVERLLASDRLPPGFTVSGREAYVWTPDGVATLKLTNTVLERKLGVTGTARNWRTVEAIAALL
ncbi:MAG: DUF1697 domain-containing protein [Actinomycetales bacterium]|nr:DUF1697 domain-containing protein [Actinomycetales bacterium]